MTDMSDITEAVADLHEINRLYQEIEMILADEGAEDFSKLLRVGSLNLEIGEITAKWI
jgi:hypothetical protein